jgi:hypothetical protein
MTIMRRVLGALGRASAGVNPEITPEVILARGVVTLASDRAAALLAALKAGLTGETDEFAQYQAAELLAGAVYPQFKFSECFPPARLSSSSAGRDH